MNLFNCTLKFGMTKSEESQSLCFLRIHCVALSLILVLQNGEHIQNTEILDLNRLYMLQPKLFFPIKNVDTGKKLGLGLGSELAHSFFIPCHFIFPRAKEMIWYHFYAFLTLRVRSKSTF